MKMPLRVLSICAALSLGVGEAWTVQAHESVAGSADSLKLHKARIDESQKYFESARTKHLNGKVIAAIEDYDKSLALMPNRVRAVGNRADLLVASGRVEEGKSEFERALRLYPEDLRTYVLYAQSLSNLGEHKASLAIYSRGLNIRSNDFLLRANRSVEYADLGDLEAAYEDARILVEQYPNDGCALSVKSGALLDLGRTGEAFAIANQAVKKSPDRCEPYGNRVRILNEMGRLKEALLDCKKEVQVMPYVSSCWNDLGRQYFLLKDKAKAIESLNKGIALNKHLGYSSLLQSLYVADDPEFDKYLKIAEAALPKSASILSYRAMYHLRNMNLYEAHKYSILAQRLNLSDQNAMWVETAIYRCLLYTSPSPRD